MKILQVINSLGTGGAEKLLLDAIPKYEDHGIEMSILLLDGTEHPFLKKLKECSKCKIHTLGMNTIYNPLLVFKIIPFLKKFDIVHVHLFPSLYWVSLAKMLSFSNITLLFTEHNISNRRRNIFFRLLDKLVYVKYKKIITISEKVDSFIKKHVGFKDSKYSLINNGVDLEKIQFANSQDPSDFVGSEKEKIIIQVSSFTKQKDQITLIKSIPFIKSPVKLLLVGVGPLFNECKALVKELDIEDQVIFLGDRMDVLTLLKTADVVVLSSKYEGLSLSGLEALASGRPLVASNVPGLEILVDGAGVLFPVGDEKQLALEIDQLLEDSDYYNRVVNSGLLRAKEYSLDKMIQKHIQLYKDICEDRN